MNKINLTSAPNLVVVSYYDGRPPTELVALLDQIAEIDAGALFDVCVVVNTINPSVPLDLPQRHKHKELLYRPNRGYNVGAWQYGWRTKREYEFYLFLQDECTIRRTGWLEAFQNVAMKPRNGLIGESLDPFVNWIAFSNYFPEVYQDCRKIAAELDIPMGKNADHLQTLVIGARREVLDRMGGFVLGESKRDAVAGEVLTSVVARAHGYRIRQVAWRPFEYINHQQWGYIRDISQRWYWSMSRAMHLYLPPILNRLIPRRRGDHWPKLK